MLDAADAADAPRTTGPIAAKGSTLSLLATLRSKAGVTGRAELQLQDLVDVEMAFAARFPSDLLALWAAAVPVLADAHKMKVTAVVGLTGALLEHKIRGDLIGIGRAQTAFVCIEKRQVRPGCELIIVDPDERTSETVSMDTWLENLIAQLDASGQSTVASEFTPVIVRPLPAASSGKKVRHAKFGEGNVLRTIGTGPLQKLQIDFPKFGLKMLQATFVEYVD